MTAVTSSPMVSSLLGLVAGVHEITRRRADHAVDELLALEGGADARACVGVLATELHGVRAGFVAPDDGCDVGRRPRIKGGRLPRVEGRCRWFGGRRGALEDGGPSEEDGQHGDRTQDGEADALHAAASWRSPSRVASSMPDGDSWASAQSVSERQA